MGMHHKLIFKGGANNMPQPAKSDVHVNRPLTNISVAFIQDASDFVASRVFPVVPVMKQSDRYFVYDKKQWFRTSAQKRAPGSESAGGGYDIDNTPNYFADVWAVHKDVDDQTRANADIPIDMDRDATAFVTQQLLLRREIEWAANYFTTGVWDTDFTPVTLWDASGSDPVADVRAQKRVIMQNTGKMANKLVVSPDVDDVLKDHEAVLDRIKGGALPNNQAIVRNQQLAQLFEIDEYLVANAVQDTAVEGAAASMDHIMTRDALLVHAAPRPSILTPSAGYTFAWVGLFGAGAAGNRISRFRMEHLKSDRVEGEMAWAQKVVAPELGVFFDNVKA